MGKVGKGIKKGLKGLGKALTFEAKMNGLHKIFQKLGLTGKHIEHTYLTVQPLSAGYEKDPIKTILATGIASGNELSEHLRDNLSNGSGVMLNRFYDYSTRRIKKHNFTTHISTRVDIDIPQIDYNALTKSFKPELRHKPYILFSARMAPSREGSLYKFMVQFKTEAMHLATHYRYGAIASIEPTMEINTNVPYVSKVVINGSEIPVISVGTLVYEDNGKKQKTIYIGNTDMPFEHNDKVDYIYLYNPEVTKHLNSTFGYIALLVANVTKKIEQSNVTVAIPSTDPRPDGIETKVKSQPIIQSDGEYSLEFKEEITRIYTDGSGRHQQTIINYHTANMDSGDNLEVLWANDTEESHIGLNVAMKSLVQKEKDNLGSIPLGQEELEKKFSFYPYLPLKQNSEYTVTFKDGDPYAGVKDLSEEERAKDDPEAKKPPRDRNNVSEGTKPRTVSRRLRRETKNTIDSRTKRKYEQACAMLGHSYETLVGQVIHGEKEGKVHYACVLPSVSLNTKVQEVKRYWFHFAKHIYKYIHNNKPLYPEYSNKNLITQSQLDTYVISLFNRGIIHAGNKVDGKWVIEAKVPVSRRIRTIPPINSIAAVNAVDGSKLSQTLTYIGAIHFKLKGTIKPKNKRRHSNYFDIRIGKNLDFNPMRTEVDCKITILGTDATSFSASYELIGSNQIPILGHDSFAFITGYEGYTHMTGNFAPGEVGTDGNLSIGGTLADKLDGTYEDNNVSYYTCFCRQVGKDTIEVYALQGLHSISLVQGMGLSLGAYEFLNDPKTIEAKGYLNMFTMPLCHDVIKRAGLINNTRFASRAVQRLDFTTYDQYVPWYARSAFKVVLTIVQVVLFVLTIYAGGAGSALVEVAKQGVAAVVRTVLIQAAIQVAIGVAIQQIVKALARVFGGQVAAILGAIAAVAMTVYGVGYGMGINLPYASQVMMVAPAITNGANTVMANLMAETQKQINVDMEAYNQAMESLEEDKNYFEEYVSSGIDTNAFVAALQTRVEKLDTFLERTLTANMNQFADLQFLSNSLDIGTLVNYEPELLLNWSGLPNDNSVPMDWDANIPKTI